MAAIKQNLTITLCGSARFEALFKAWNEALTICGHTVFTLTAFPSEKGRKAWYSESVKQEMDAAHFRKIALSDGILVINRFGYIGESTMREIDHARSLGKDVYFIESWGKGEGVSAVSGVVLRELCESFDLGRACKSPIDTSKDTQGNLCPFWDGLIALSGDKRDAASRLVREAGLRPGGVPSTPLSHDVVNQLASVWEEEGTRLKRRLDDGTYQTYMQFSMPRLEHFVQAAIAASRSA